MSVIFFTLDFKPEVFRTLQSSISVICYISSKNRFYEHAACCSFYQKVIVNNNLLISLWIILFWEFILIEKSKFPLAPLRFNSDSIRSSPYMYIPLGITSKKSLSLYIYKLVRYSPIISIILGVNDRRVKSGKSSRAISWLNLPNLGQKW